MSRRKMIMIGVAVMLAAAIAALAWLGGDEIPAENRHPTTRGATATEPAPGSHRASGLDQAGPVAGTLTRHPVTNDPRVLGRWIAETVYGIDYRGSRASYLDALWAVSLGADTDEDNVREAFASDPALAGVVELVPAPGTWARMAEHEQRSTLEVREPIGAQDVEIDAELAEAGVATTMVLVTGTQTIRYTGNEGTNQTHTIQPSLQMLIGCTPRWDGCRLLRVIDRQP